jgi:hypothetical protein
MMSLRTHNVLDYVTGVVLLFIPAIFGFAEIDAARNSFLGAGIAIIAYSLLTRYEYALWRVIPLGTHMTLDVIDGVFVMLAPWIFGYRDLLTAGQEVLHYVAALAIFGLVAFTRTKAESDVLSGTTYTSERDRLAG